jgi:hypothetical protein
MIMRKIAGVFLLMNLSLYGMEADVGATQQDEREFRVSEFEASASRASIITASESAEVFVPQNIDVTCCLESSGRCCYVMYSLCKFGVGVCEFAALVCEGFSVMEINDNPVIARNTGIAAVVTGSVGLALTYALVKLNKKIRNLDNALGEARRRQAASEV